MMIHPLDQERIRISHGRAPDGSTRYVTIPLETLRTHAHIVATTGAGKSHLLKVLLGEILRVGGGFGVSDFKGDLVRDLLRMIPQERWADVVVFDPTDHAWPVGLNLLDPMMLRGGALTDMLLSQLEATIAGLDDNWSSSVGMQQFLGWGGKALLDGERTPTLDHLYTFYSSTAYREQVLTNLTDVQTRFWWEHTFPQLPDQQKTSMVALQRRLDQFRMNTILRRTCNQARTTIPFRRLMDERGILLAKLPVEIIGAKEGAFLASLLVTLTIAAAFTRQSLPEPEREIWPYVIDEFQEALGRGNPRDYLTILERMRSFGVGAVLAHQHLGQLPPEVREATLNMIPTRFILSALGSDAGIWAKQYPGSGLSADDFANIPIREEGYMTVPIQGLPIPPFTFTPLPLWPEPTYQVEPVAAEADWQTMTPPPRNADERAMDDRIRLIARLSDDDALETLVRAPERLWIAYQARTAAWRAHQRQAILREPGLVADDAARLTWLSRLRVARPQREVQADLVRRALQYPRDEGGAAAPVRRSPSAGPTGGGNASGLPSPPATTDQHDGSRNRAGAAPSWEGIEDAAARDPDGFWHAYDA